MYEAVITKPVFECFQYDNSPNVNQENKNRHFPFLARNAFTQTDLVSTEDDQTQELIHQIRRSPVISNQANLANQLITLFNFAKEESPNTLGISVNSISSFYDFLTMNSDIISPRLSLSPDHNIYATWKTDKRLFSAHFLQYGDIHFVLFQPNYRHPKRKIRISGLLTDDTLTKVVVRDNLKGLLFIER